MRESKRTCSDDGQQQTFGRGPSHVCQNTCINRLGLVSNIGYGSWSWLEVACTEEQAMNSPLRSMFTEILPDGYTARTVPTAFLQSMRSFTINHDPSGDVAGLVTRQLYLWG